MVKELVKDNKEMHDWIQLAEIFRKMFNGHYGNISCGDSKFRKFFG